MKSEATLRRDIVLGFPLGAAAGLAAFVISKDNLGTSLLAVALLFAFVALAWWLLTGACRWVAVFLASALLLPPLPLPWGDAGPHPAMLVAALGLLVGLARLRAWDFRRRALSAALLLLWFALFASVPLAALHAGPQVALGTLARTGLFGISVYLFFYVADGPGRALSGSSLVRLLFWVGFLTAAFACLDFYFQFPAPARFASQFVWLPAGVFRRAQGVFYEASTLGLLCVFLLVMIAAVAVLRLGGALGIRALWLGAGAATLLAALILSFSRAAMMSLAVSLACMIWIERKRLGLDARFARIAMLAASCLAGGGLLLYGLFPRFLGAYVERFWLSGLYLVEAPNLILSRRLESWEFLIGYLREHPWHALFGIGYKTLPYSGFVGRTVVADNMYLSLLIETGVVGLGALLLLHAAVLRAGYKWATAPHCAPPGLRRLFGVWMFSFWCGLALQMLSGDLLTYWRILPAFFAVLAIATREPRDARPLP